MPKMKRDAAATATNSAKCKWCHYSPFRRTVHLLDMLERNPSADLRKHLYDEFRDTQTDASGFFDAELRSVDFVTHNYKHWREWQEGKTSSITIARIADWLPNQFNS